jgi:hypothetical protein
LSSSKARKTRLWRFFRITPEEYDRILAHQGGVCAGCGCKPGKNRLAVDHDHKTGKIRGLLCWTCNSTLGEALDSPQRLFKLYKYLVTNPAFEALGKVIYGILGKAQAKKVMKYGPPARKK